MSGRDNTLCLATAEKGRNAFPSCIFKGQKESVFRADRREAAAS